MDNIFGMKRSKTAEYIFQDFFLISDRLAMVGKLQEAVLQMLIYHYGGIRNAITRSSDIAVLRDSG